MKSKNSIKIFINKYRNHFLRYYVLEIFLSKKLSTVDFFLKEMMILDRQIEDSLEIYQEVERRTLDDANSIKDAHPNESQQLRLFLYKNLKDQIKTTRILIITKKKKIKAFRIFSGRVYCYLVSVSFFWIVVSFLLTIGFSKIIELVI